MSIATDFPGGQHINNNYNTFGNDGHTTIHRNLNSDKDGKGHPLTHDREMSFY